LPTKVQSYHQPSFEPDPLPMEEQSL